MKIITGNTGTVHTHVAWCIFQAQVDNFFCRQGGRDVPLGPAIISSEATLLLSLPNDVRATNRHPTSVTRVTHSIHFDRRFPVNTFHVYIQLWTTRVTTQEVILFICDVQLKPQTN